MADKNAEKVQIVAALREAFTGDDFEENARAAAGEGEWSWFRWLAVSTVEGLHTSQEEVCDA